MANREINEESVLLKTNTSIEKLPDGSCIKRITETKNGKTEVTEEKMDCDLALKEVKEKDDNNFSQENNSFDERMRDRLKEMKQSFSKEENKGKITTNEETYGDGTNKVVKVTRESDSIEETKKTEKIPDGTKRILKISREHFFEETKKSVGPMETEEEPEAVKLLDESFAEEAKDKTSEEKKDSAEEIQDDNNQEKKEDNDVKDGDKEEEESDDTGEENYSVEENNGQQKNPEENMRIVEAEDGLIKRMVKGVFKLLFWPLFKLKIL